jgi:DNA topoisomerase-2
MPKGGYKLTGIIKKIDAVTIEITELPLRSWTQSYKEQLEEWLTGTPKTPAWIADYKEHHTDTRVHFIVTLISEAEMKKAESEGLEKRFKLTTTIATTNIVCFDMAGRIRKYTDVAIILTEFYEMRLKFYQKRKVCLPVLMR